MNEIAFVALLPRNDAGNSRLFVMRSDEIPRSSRGMTQGLGILEFLKIRHCEALKKEGAISFIKPCL
ncbi:MAG: hypothetical protein SO038_00135 [Campylobacter sp.]|nr:hypothetical protein [Campylobacter sp.]